MAEFEITQQVSRNWWKKNAISPLFRDAFAANCAASETEHDGPHQSGMCTSIITAGIFPPGYSELNDPITQRGARLVTGRGETQKVDEDFLLRWSMGSARRWFGWVLTGLICFWRALNRFGIYSFRNLETETPRWSVAVFCEVKMDSAYIRIFQLV